MIHIDKSKSSQLIILYLNGLTDVDNPTYTLSIKSEYSNKDISLVLGTDVSDYPDSYNKFLIDVSIFEEYEVGMYSYSVLVGSDTIDAGYIRLFTSVPDEYTLPEPVSLPTSDTDDDFKTYQIEND